MQVRVLMALIGLFVAVLVAPAHAQDTDEPTIPRDAFPEQGPVPIGDGYAFTGAVVTPPDGGPVRTLDAYEAAVFVQSWLAQALFGNEDSLKDPPPDLPVHRVDIEGDWVAGVGRITVYFATDGTTPYIAFPQTQTVVTDPSAPPPEPADWFTGRERIIDAFNGEAELIETTGTQQITSPTTTPGSEEASADERSNGLPPWVWGIGVAVAVIVAGLLLRWRRRSSRSSEPIDEPEHASP